MPFSFHSHSGQFCQHAKDTLEQVVQEAIRRKMLVFGLTEHMPRFYRQHLYPEESHLAPDDLLCTFEQFLAEARRLQRVYAGKITLLVGVETEYLDAITSEQRSGIPFPDTHAYLDHIRANVDYIVGSVHHVRGVPIDFSKEEFQRAVEMCGGPVQTPAARLDHLYCAYFDAVADLIERHRPMVIGHFDLCRMFVHSQNPVIEVSDSLSEAVWHRIRHCTRVILSYGALVEINTRGWKKMNSAYPRPDVLKYLVSMGVRFTLSDDAHAAQDVAMYYERVPAYLVEVGIKELYFLDRSVKDGAVSVRCLENICNHPFWKEFRA